MNQTKDLLQDKFKGAILGCFLGDAFGAGFEGMSPDMAKSHLIIILSLQVVLLP